AGSKITAVFRTTFCQSQEADLSQTVRAMPGEDVVLPCHVDPPLDLSQFTVEWGRPDLKPRFVHVWHNQKEYLADQNKVFKGRTSLKQNTLSVFLLVSKPNNKCIYLYQDWFTVLLKPNRFTLRYIFNKGNLVLGFKWFGSVRR
uniref:Immunoglobulin V-set domain-containing protein n=1 Tax=Xiphophorus couchianus TaxID=32473 RepID=A0A3B5LDE4_9TELE